MNKQIAVIACDATAALYHAGAIRDLIRNRAEVRPYSTGKVEQEGVPTADLYCITTDALKQLPAFRSQISPSADVVILFVTFTKAAVQKLYEIPAGSNVLFVNLNREMALEGITGLAQIGVDHISFTPYYPEADFEVDSSITIAVTPDEERYVPPGIKTVLNMGQRRMDYNTVTDLLMKLKFYDLMSAPHISSYLSSLASNYHGVSDLLYRSLNIESSLDQVLNALDIGIIGIDNSADIFLYNQKAEDILGVSLANSYGHSVSSVAFDFPLNDYMAQGGESAGRLTHFHDRTFSFKIVSVTRQQEKIGHLIILRPFEEDEARQNKIRIQLLDRGHTAKYVFDDIIGVSPEIQRVKGIAQKMAKTNASILITGESGTGKELFAHAIHNASLRRDNPFIAINCAALPENLLESELFGYAPGAFTGANKNGKMGLFEFAHTGTFFLDEVEGMSPSLQIKLLRVLQEHEVMRVGGNRVTYVDVRIIAASNESLERLVANGSFRSDLYYRLNTLPINIPPLRERPDDILPLIEHFKAGIHAQFTLSGPVREIFLAHPWHGNIRELRNCVDYFSYLDKPVIDVSDLPPGFYGSAAPLPAGAPVVRQAVDRPPEVPAEAPVEELLQARREVCRFILRTLGQPRDARTVIGREYLFQRARESGILTTGYEIRLVLSQLKEGQYVRVTRGRGGIRITEKGKELLDTL